MVFPAPQGAMLPIPPTLPSPQPDAQPSPTLVDRVPRLLRELQNYNNPGPKELELPSRRSHRNT